VSEFQVKTAVKNKEDIKVIERAFAGLPCIKVRTESICNTTHPCLITAGNSFGKMDGGVDGMINTFLSSHTPGEYVQQWVELAIRQKCGGELGVGQAIAVTSVKHPKVHVLVYASTMRVPESVADTLNAYTAFRSALVQAALAGMSSVASPLLCTGAGEMSVDKACRQMRAAYESLLIGGETGMSWPDIHERHRALKRI
jgi:O-acetyl-ADP-ribose deacetylase (regulator of RNase III)